jgi:alkylation response protein AidB-like acyl-CoA dehydrogenase
VRIEETWRALGMRGTGSHDVVLDGVFVADAAIAGRRPQGKWHRLFHIISMVDLPLIYSAYVGVAEAACERALALVAARRDDPDVQLMAGEMHNELAAAQMALADMLDNAASLEPGPAATSRALTGRILAGQAAIRTVEKAMALAGGAAMYRARGIERLFRDVQGARFHPVPEKTQQRLAGRLALGLDIDA